VRVFLDTNVLASAFASRGLCAEVLELVLLDQDLVAGRYALREIDRVLRDEIRVPAARSAEIVEFVANEAIETVEHALPVMANVDGEDALVLGEALAGRAQWFITGDAALLRLDRIDSPGILSPRQFWELLREQP
jgi:putative PIN family toxin of toxin-antitoxin system